MIKSKAKLKNEIMQILFWHFAFGTQITQMLCNADFRRFFWHTDNADAI
jgi:hypothetical protein